MTYCFGASVIGEGKNVCQDYNRSESFKNGVIAVIADGVGTAMYSDIGAKLAADTLISLFLENYYDDMSDIEGIQLLENGYREALLNINKLAEEKQYDTRIFDTTLTCIVITNLWGIYGHCGDGAILIIKQNGILEKITVEYSGQFANEVFPLSAGREFWNFGICEYNALSYILVTDGILNFLDYVHKDEINRFYINNIQQFKKKKYNKKECDDYIRKMLKTDIVKKATRDDKTFLMIVNDVCELPKLRDSRINPIMYVENNYYLDYASEKFEMLPNELVKIAGLKGKLYCDAKSKLQSIVFNYDNYYVVNLFYPIIEVEPVIYIDNGVNYAIQLSTYLLYKVEEYYNLQLEKSDMVWSIEETLNINIESVLTIDIQSYDKIIIWQYRNFFEICIAISNNDAIKSNIHERLFNNMYIISTIFRKGLSILKEKKGIIPFPDKACNLFIEEL